MGLPKLGASLLNSGLIPPDASSAAKSFVLAAASWRPTAHFVQILVQISGF